MLLENGRGDDFYYELQVYQVNTLYISITLMNDCIVTPQVTSTVDHPTSCCAGRGFVCVLL